ncbi:MAG: hypothetical protein EP330_20500 [Deltaproteobacteria bacterium]|nr:MAG: hypothetical protein EP330_20500 [Deltaproteobacteria bacterium]
MWSLLLSLALASPLPSTTAEGERLPYLQSRMSPYDPGPPLPVAAERRFVRMNRTARGGSLAAVAGLGAAGLGMLVRAEAWSIGSPALYGIGWGVFFAGGAAAVGGPVLGLATAGVAANVLRDHGVEVPKTWFYIGVVSVVLSAAILVVPVTYPVLVVAPFAQARVNQRHFVGRMGRGPDPGLVLHVVPLDGGRALALGGRW